MTPPERDGDMVYEWGSVAGSVKEHAVRPPSIDDTAFCGALVAVPHPDEEWDRDSENVCRSCKRYIEAFERSLEKGHSG